MSILKDIKMRTLRHVKSTCPHCSRQSKHSLSRIKNNITLICPLLWKHLSSIGKQTNKVTD
ncbi:MULTISPECIES: YnfU family zinc-binding protein [Citrobacter freundii complex]|uniref:YnfU family zinc-binding protein n=1 Tax=Citrobacter freundii complex TaxID=1344959 RepID=UPI0030823B01